MGVRDRVREFIEAMVEAELEAALSRPRHAAAASDRTRRRAAHSVSCATVMATGRARYWGLSARSRLRCRAPGFVIYEVCGISLGKVRARDQRVRFKARLFHSVVLPSGVFSRARGIAI
jgi:hypothetical protein